MTVGELIEKLRREDPDAVVEFVTSDATMPVESVTAMMSNGVIERVWLAENID